jgi:hypothetical protein
VIITVPPSAAICCGPEFDLLTPNG